MAKTHLPASIQQKLEQLAQCVDQLQWRVVPSLPNVYVSSLGQVMARPRVIAPGQPDSFRGGVPTFGWYSPEKQRFEYKYAKKNYRVSRLICEAWYGPSPPGKSVCMHLDEDATNNRPENLRWGTQTENMNFPKVKEKQRMPRKLRRKLNVLEEKLNARS